MRVIIDSEWNRLELPDVCWLIVCRNIDNPDEVFVFERPDKNPNEFNEFAKKVKVWIGHNLIDYDIPNLHRYGLAGGIDPRGVIDTLIVSRLINFRIDGGHSLDAWAQRLRLPIQKTKITDFTKYSPELLERCIGDTYINLKVFLQLEKYINDKSFNESLRLEHDIGYICYTLKENGFPFDKQKAIELRKEIAVRLEEIDNQLIRSFPSEVTVVKEFTPKLTKTGTLNSKDFRWLPNGSDVSFFKPETEYSLVSLEPYNPSSIKQTIERLNEAGWKPTEKTKGHSELTSRRGGRRRDVRSPEVSVEKLERFSTYGWKLSEDNLRTLPDTAPEAARKLVERLLLASRISDLDEWLGLCKANVEGNNVHGYFNGIGSWTHRLSTSRPNMQNIPVPQHKDNPSTIDKLSDTINESMRSLWIARRGHRLLGVDADGIQMRGFAHYVNDKRLIDALVTGDKKNGTDIHTLHWKALGAACKGRNPAKTFIYAFLLGAGIAKVAEILECAIGQASTAVGNFLDFYPGLATIKRTQIPADAHRGYFIGLDGRKVVCSNEHLILAGYLQNFEAVVMKRACRQWHIDFRREKIPFKFRTWPHDEWQTELPDDDVLCEEAKEIQIASIVKQGVELGLNCPLAAQGRYGYTWAETH